MQGCDPERLELFNDALQALLTSLLPSAESDEARRRVTAEMQSVVGRVLPPELHCGIETFGSFRAGLHLPGSDMDFALSGWVEVAPTPPVPFAGEDDDEPFEFTGTGSSSGKAGGGAASPSWRQQQQQQQQPRRLELHEWDPHEQQLLLADLADALEGEGLVRGQVERVLHARVPVLKFTHGPTGLACDVSINRPECAFKAEMQKLLSSLDRRYACLYRLIKAWAAIHGLNDAASNTLNSWSLGLMLVFYLQNEAPAILPPVWQLLERSPPARSAPRLLQQPGITCSQLRRVATLAATGAAAWQLKQKRQGPAATNPKSLAELLLGFFGCFGAQMSDWVAASSSSSSGGSNGSSSGRRGVRASCWWGSWVEAAWPPGRQYIFGIEEPFHAEDNTARSVGTHNHLSSINVASYICATFNTSASLTQQALCGSSSSSSTPEQAVLSSFCWLFGPAAVLDGVQRLPPPLARHFEACCPSSLVREMTLQLSQLGRDVNAVLALSSAAANSGSNRRHHHHHHQQQQQEQKDQQQQAEAAAEQVKRHVTAAVTLFQRLLLALGCQQLDVCLADHLKVLKAKQQLEDERRRQEWQQQEQQQQQQRERDRQQEQRRREQRRQIEWQQQQQQLLARAGAVSAVAGTIGQQEGGSSSSSSGRRERRGQPQQHQQPEFQNIAAAAAGDWQALRSAAGASQAQQQQQQPGDGGSSSRRERRAQPQQQQQQQQQRVAADPAAAAGARSLAAAAAAAAASTGSSVAAAAAAAARSRQQQSGKQVPAQQQQQQQGQRLLPVSPPAAAAAAAGSGFAGGDAADVGGSSGSSSGNQHRRQRQQARGRGGRGTPAAMDGVGGVAPTQQQQRQGQGQQPRFQGIVATAAGEGQAQQQAQQGQRRRQQRPRPEQPRFTGIATAAAQDWQQLMADSR